MVRCPAWGAVASVGAVLPSADIPGGPRPCPRCPWLALDFPPWAQGADLVREPVQIDVVTNYDVPVRVAYEIVFAQDCPLRVIASLHNAHGSAALGEQ